MQGAQLRYVIKFVADIDKAVKFYCVTRIILASGKLVCGTCPFIPQIFLGGHVDFVEFQLRDQKREAKGR